jgi:hypothetical protein
MTKFFTCCIRSVDPVGLDFTELVMDIEEAFGVSFDLDEFRKMQTPNALIEVIRHKTLVSSQEQCLGMKVFHRIRSKLMEQFQHDRASIRPNTSLSMLFPAPIRKKQWLQLKATLGLTHWPALVRPVGLKVFIGCLFFAVWVGLACFLKANPRLASALPATFLEYQALTACTAAALLTAAVLTMTTCCKNTFSSTCQTLADLARFLLAKHPLAFKPDPLSWSDSEIATVVKQILRETLGIKKYSGDSSFLEDLGVD